MDEGRWADQKANEVRAKQAKEQTERETRLLEDRQRLAESPRLWDEFVANVKQRVKAFNQAFRSDALEVRQAKADEISVGIHQFITKISAEFIRDPRLEIRCSLVNTSKEYAFKAFKDKVALTPAREAHIGIAMTPQEVAEEFVDAIIKFL